MAGQKNKFIPLGIAFLIAVVLFYGVGFAPGFFHAAAHDLRLALAIPSY